MLIPLHSLIKKYNLQITGVLHIGAHWAEEHGDYTQAGIEHIAYIEASPKTFGVLKSKRFPATVKLYNVACADYTGYSDMYAESDNQGQSSSLLAPGTHTKHYPSIRFNERETVKVVTLDSLRLTRYNFMNVDVQGAEAMVFRGGVKTLAHVDYIYTEVNTENVYEGAPHVDELDSILTDFTRVETFMTSQGWGDSLYIRRSLL